MPLPMWREKRMNRTKRSGRLLPPVARAAKAEGPPEMSNLKKLIIDGIEVEVDPAMTLIQAAEVAGVEIPRFCYHERLTIAGNCRMCLVEVVGGPPKPAASCAMQVKDLRGGPNGEPAVVKTNSPMVKKAREGVMEFLLINHPLDCPICDQGGECQLQDLAVGYGGSNSRYEEEKRVVAIKDVGPLISMQEMSRCIHCTRCVRFGQEVAGVMELGMSHRGEHAEIETFVGQTVDSELSGNMIDICPVGALTSKPFRYSARTWELSRRKSVSPHDSTGANLVVQVKNNHVMRVVPLENDAVNECWIADRDRFSYEALSSPDRLHTPMIKQGGKWSSVDWQTALEYVANGLKQIKSNHGAQSLGALVSPHSTLEELHLAATLVRGLGSENIDHRLRNQDFTSTDGVRYLGMPIAGLSTLQRVLLIGTNLRKEHPLFALRVRQAARSGCAVHALRSDAANWAIPIAQDVQASSQDWLVHIQAIAAAVAQLAETSCPYSATVNDQALAIAKSLLGGERKAVLLGNGAAHHAQASALQAVAAWIANAQSGLAAQ